MNLPNSLKKIDDWAFWQCEKWSSIITIPESLTTIEEGVFSSCDSLTKIYLPLSLCEIEDYALISNNSLELIEFQNKNCIIGPEVFRFENSTYSESLNFIVIGPPEGSVQVYCENNEITFIGI